MVAVGVGTMNETPSLFDQLRVARMAVFYGLVPEMEIHDEETRVRVYRDGQDVRVKVLVNG